MFIENKYSKCYYSIINRAKSRIIDANVYTEKHHIIPKSCGGDNSKINLVLLTAREHFICHMLLPKFTTGSYRHKMVHALWRMCNALKTEYKVSSRIYTQSKEKHIQILSTVGTTGQFKLGHTTWNKGIPRTDAVKQAISNGNKGRKHPTRTSESFTEEWRAKISLSARTRAKKTCPYCSKEAGPTNYIRWHGDNCRAKS